MLQDINPHKLDNQYRPRIAGENDYIISFDEKRNVLLINDDDHPMIPTLGDLSSKHSIKQEELTYLFSIDEMGFFLCPEILEIEGFGYYNNRAFPEDVGSWEPFAIATALHLNGWYAAGKYCGRCGSPMKHKKDERALYCPECGYLEYPKISPVVIVGIINDDKLLLTKYSQAAYKKHALVAGFMEIGETPEDTVRREVMEETGIKVKNIRYYKSQPWAYSESVLMGFFADLDGSSTVSLDDEELSEAEWFKREDIPDGDSTMSLTWTMIECFRSGKV